MVVDLIFASLYTVIGDPGYIIENENNTKDFCHSFSITLLIFIFITSILLDTIQRKDTLIQRRYVYFLIC